MGTIPVFSLATTTSCRKPQYRLKTSLLSRTLISLPNIRETQDLRIAVDVDVSIILHLFILRVFFTSTGECAVQISLAHQFLSRAIVYIFAVPMKGPRRKSTRSPPPSHRTYCISSVVLRETSASATSFCRTTLVFLERRGR